MEQLCHRCSTAVSREDAFCPNCGAPQLNFDASDQQPFGENSEAAHIESRPGQIHWRIALAACAKVAIPAGILCGLLPEGSLLWVLGAATGVILLYRRKRPTSTLTAKNGLRIGALAGMIIAYISAAATAILRVLQRYPMHVGKALDEGYEQLIHLSTSQLQMQSMYQYMLSPDGRAAYAFMGMAAAAIMTVLLASVGGAVGVRLSTVRRRTG